MPFKPGHHIGRPKGSKDKRSRYYDVVRALDEHNHDPVIAMIMLAKDETVEPELRFKADKELVARIAPILKAVEMSGSVENTEEVERLKKQLKEIEERLEAKHKKEF